MTAPESPLPQTSPSPPSPAADSKPTADSEPPADCAPPADSEPDADSKPPADSKPRKSVGFAPPPQDDLDAHHKKLKQVEQERLKSNPFHKIPAELAYLEKHAPAPKPLPSFTAKPERKSAPYKELGDLRLLAIKTLSVVNRQTEVNYSYPSIDRPIPAHKLIVAVRFALLQLVDLGKINKYPLNISEHRVGLGYDFAGEVVDVGRNFGARDEGALALGAVVVGCVNPQGRKGLLLTSLLVDPRRDVVVVVSEDTLAKLARVQVLIGGEEESKFEVDEPEAAATPEAAPAAAAAAPAKPRIGTFALDPALTPLAKLATFPLLYARAKTALSHSHAAICRAGRANILINGADTNIGLTLIQLLHSLVYQAVERLNLVLVIREESTQQMEAMVKLFGRFDPHRSIRVTCVPFDLYDEDYIVLPGERRPVQYKKPNLFACDILNALLYEPGVSRQNVNQYKLDLMVDVVGGTKLFQTLLVNFGMLEALLYPFAANLAPGEHLLQIFSAGQFLVSILKPKLQGSAFVGLCHYGLKYPSYNVDDLTVDRDSIVNPWALKWSTGLANSWFSLYNYYEHVDLEVKKEWLVEGLQLLVDGELKFLVEDYKDWRDGYQAVIAKMKRGDAKAVFKVEEF